MDTTLHAPGAIVADLIALIDKGLKKEGAKTPKGAEWGLPGNALQLNAGDGTGSHTFVHCKEQKDFDDLYTELTERLKLEIKEEKRCLPEYYSKGKDVSPGKTTFFSVYLQATKSLGGSTEMLTESDSLGVIHNPNY
ncbi:hypothetical protein AUC43_15575 [Hymenobacter sedentarius]|uniref:Uncharacterized protein n=1 Tax=Hymenobacter sedentarius TaxID=1411621 RepID=A0A0U4ADW8_9BACT|nr:hypothetical protein [Hymenobacter sedentarius]ALW86380.1 hypothetical protein AUC43_15575 [Hymenobacter sedentarius]